MVLMEGILGGVEKRTRRVRGARCLPILEQGRVPCVSRSPCRVELPAAYLTPPALFRHVQPIVHYSCRTAGPPLSPLLPRGTRASSGRPALGLFEGGAFCTGAFCTTLFKSWDTHT